MQNMVRASVLVQPDASMLSGREGPERKKKGKKEEKMEILYLAQQNQKALLDFIILKVPIN